jgi:hypothetical protein
MAGASTDDVVDSNTLLKEPVKEAILKHCKHECRLFYSMTGSPENTKALMAMLAKRYPDFRQLKKS